jgi:hypothetical protein
MLRMALMVIVLVLSFGGPVMAADGFDCPSVCEQNGRKALEACKTNHPNDPGYCPADDGHILDHCREICEGLAGKSPDDLRKMLPENYKDIQEGK